MMYQFIGKQNKMYDIDKVPNIKLNYKCEFNGIDNKCNFENDIETNTQQTKSIINNTDKYYGFKSKLREKITDSVQLSNLSPKNIPILNTHLENMQLRCQKLGIPRLRGVVVDKPVKESMASMGDGILALSDDALRNNEQEMLSILINRNKAKLESSIKQSNIIKMYMEDSKKKFEKNNPKTSWEGSWRQKEWLQQEGKYLKEYMEEIEQCKARLNELETNGVDALVSSWKIGDDKAKRPFSVDEYFKMVDRPKLVLDHEFGHHIHQQMGVIDKKTFNNPPVEQDIEKIYNIASKRKDFVSPSKYADSEPQEWFAESYSLHVNGRDDLVDKRLLKYFKEKKI